MTDFPVIPDPNKILIVDTSKWQDDPNTPQNIDFQKMKSFGGVSGVIMKVGQGIVIDRNWQLGFEESLKASMPRGGYWYYDNRVDPSRQATEFANQVKQKTLPLGLWLDLEDRTEGVHKGWKNWYVFLEKLKELVPNALVGIYTGYYYWVERTVSSGIPPTSLQYFKQFPLWIAAYNDNYPIIPAPWGQDYLIWQFTDLLDGKKYGVESFELDGSYFNGTLEEYENYFKLDEIIPPVITPPEETVGATYNCVARFKVKVRPDPSTSNATDLYLLEGESFQISEIVSDRLDPANILKRWGHIFGGKYDGKYTALEYPGNESPISTYTPIVAVPPPTEVVLTHTIEVCSDGSITVDGTAF